MPLLAPDMALEEPDFFFEELVLFEDLVPLPERSVAPVPREVSRAEAPAVPALSPELERPRYPSRVEALGDLPRSYFFAVAESL